MLILGFVSEKYPEKQFIRCLLFTSVFLGVLTCILCRNVSMFVVGFMFEFFFRKTGVKNTHRKNIFLYVLAHLESHDGNIFQKAMTSLRASNIDDLNRIKITRLAYRKTTQKEVIFDFHFFWCYRIHYQKGKNIFGIELDKMK